MPKRRGRNPRPGGVHTLPIVNITVEDILKGDYVKGLIDVDQLEQELDDYFVRGTVPARFVGGLPDRDPGKPSAY